MRWSPQSRWVPAALAILDHFPDSNFTSIEAIRVVPGFKNVARELRVQGILIRKYRGNNNKKPSVYALGQEAKEWLKTQR